LLGFEQCSVVLQVVVFPNRQVILASDTFKQCLQATPSNDTLKQYRQAISASALCKFTLALTSFPEEFVKNAIYPHEFIVQS
jgi:hypothetical protein